MSTDRLVQQLRNDEYAIEADLIESQQYRIAELEAEVEDVTRNKMLSEHAYGNHILEQADRIAELEASKNEPLALYDFIDSYEGLPMMQMWDWLMYNGYTERVQEQAEEQG
jgi:hypothetical protein